MMYYILMHCMQRRKNMDFLKKNMQKTEVQNENDGKIREAENGWMNAKKAIEDAIFELGKSYFEANKDNAASEFAEKIETIKNKNREEYMWHQYRLSLDGQRLCDSCNSIITSDSAFCNRCGAAVAPIDFSDILGTTTEKNNQSEASSEQVIYCHNCGKKLVEGVIFCDSCGTKLE